MTPSAPLDKNFGPLCLTFGEKSKGGIARVSKLRAVSSIYPLTCSSLLKYNIYFDHM